mmetsp:Transcript_35563/g.83077  ORF Transcript_35563/g.83077 Transcript_35563/m.83077 type:complete len:1097 (-) Transcript_35563:91-3381(-)
MMTTDAQRLVAFLATHCIAFVSEVFAMIQFAYSDDPMFCFCLVMVFSFSGAFCTHAAWNSSKVGWWLPLKDWPWPVAVLLALPLGFWQGIIVILAVEEYRSRHPGSAENDGESSSLANKPAAKYHCKAVNGIFEGCVSSAVMLYAFWTLDYPPPPDDPITKPRWRHERLFLGIVGLVMFFTSGLGLLELDFCTSRAVAKCMKRLPYETLHYLFRTCEVISRASIFIAFMVVTRTDTYLWWLPLFLDFSITLGLVTYFGGAEAQPFGLLVRLLCSVPCFFANVFLFIDSPYKTRAARRLSRCLTVKAALWQIILPSVLVAPLFTHDAADRPWDVMRFWAQHKTTNLIVLVSTPLYWFLLWWIHTPLVRGNQVVDIYSACANGSVKQLHDATRLLTQSHRMGHLAGLDVNCYDIDGRTPLMVAALYGHAPLCKHLVREGARAEMKVYDDRRPFVRWFSVLVRRRWTALHIAAWQGHVEVVKELVAHVGPDEDLVRSRRSQWCDSRGDTPLHIAAKHGHMECAVEIARVRPEWMTALNSGNRTPVMLARSQEVKEAIQSVEAGSSAGLVGLCSSPQTSLLPSPGASSTCPSEMLRQSTPLEGQALEDLYQKHWPTTKFDIGRTNLSPTYQAPGLCSYIVSCCGGALGQVFLVNDSTRPRQDNLSVISEVDQESAADTAVSQATSQPPAGFPIHNLIAVDKSDKEVKYMWWSATTRPRAFQSHRGSRRCCGGDSQSPVPVEQLRPDVPKDALLGQGAQGAVWRAMDKASKEHFAVKNIKVKGGGAASVSQREYDIASHLKVTPHPCIVKLLHIHAFEDTSLTMYCLVMEYCTGGDLFSKVTEKYNRQTKLWSGEGGKYEVSTRHAFWAGQVFLGLELMHIRTKTLLRDLKLENVVLDSNLCAKLTDFGFGRRGLQSDGTWSFGYPTGTPGYVAPEILAKEEYDERADLYSFGVLIWVLLTGGLQSKPGLPPSVAGRDQPFEAFKDDWKLLHKCLDHASLNPEIRRQHQEECNCHKEIPGFGLRTQPNLQQSLPTEPLEQLVRDLVQRNYKDRPSHRGIRESTAMQDLKLPRADAKKDDVEDWIKKWLHACRLQEEQNRTR